MFSNIIRKIIRQLVLLVVVALVLLAAYVSLGRQFMPEIAAYSDFVEEQIFEITGLPVSVDAIAGNFEGFNPHVEVSGLSLQVGDGTDAANALQFDSALVVLDVFGSIWQRRWVLEEFAIERLELTVSQDEAGRWRLGDVSAGGNADIETLYQAFQRVARLDLFDVVINVENRLGDTVRFTEGVVTIQNRGQEHYIHVDAIHEGSAEPLQLSLELIGNDLAEVDGSLHARVPASNYSNIIRGESFGDVQVAELVGAADLWLHWEEGELLESVASLDLEALTVVMPGAEPLTLEALRGDARLRRMENSPDQSAWSLTLSEMTITHADHFWRPFSLHAEFEPQQQLDLRVEAINLDLLAAVMLESGQLDSQARTQLLGYSPAGNLRNLVVNIPLGENNQEVLRLRGNLDNVELGSVRGSPNMWGIDGYFQLEFDPAGNIASGFAEVESDNFSINIPNVFTQVWDYSYVNGDIRFEVDLNDGEKVTLDSGVIVAESSAVDGHVRFRSSVNRSASGERDAELDLVIGASRVDAEQKTLYLPDGPQIPDNLRNSMEFLEAAIQSGTITRSGIIFRGKTLAGTGPETKTFQSFFLLDDGELQFSQDWPALERLSAVVATDDNNIDIEVLSGGSMDLSMGAAAGVIRRNELDENWLTITGQANGTTNAGLDYLQSAPVGEALKTAFADWRAEGEFDADIEVLVPLSQPGRAPDVRLDMQLAENDLSINNLDINVTELSGPIVFDTRTGLENSRLQGQIFGDAVEIDLSSQMIAGELASIIVNASGRTTPAEMIAWPRQSNFVRDIFRRAEGEFAYDALITVDQTGRAEAGTVLTIDTDFAATGFDLPAPFAKPADQAKPLALQIDFMGERQRISGSFGGMTRFQLDLLNDSLADGLVYISPIDDQFAMLAENEVDGLAIVGELEYFDLQQWLGFLDSLATVDNPVDDFSNAIAFVDIEAGLFSLYGQELPGVAFRLQPDATRQGWLAQLDGDSVAGDVLIPFRSEDALQIDLQHLRLPPEPETDTEIPEGLDLAEMELTELEEERIDPLLDLDPRSLPSMRFSTEEFAIGERQFGQWAFTLNPTAEGAEFTDLAFDFRGLRLGMDETPADIEQLTPHFAWHYDGVEHHSALTGVLTTDDIGEVLLANGFAASLVSSEAIFVSELDWPGSPAFFSGSALSGRLDMLIEDGRFLQESGGAGALKLVSIINFSAIMRRLRFSDDLLRRGLAFDEITGNLLLEDGVVDIQDRLVISGPSSLYQITGDVNLADETINGEMFVTLPVSDNIPWLGLLTANLPLAVGAYLFDQIFGDQVDSLTSAVYTLQGPWEGLQPEFKQAFGSPESEEAESIATDPAAQ